MLDDIEFKKPKWMIPTPAEVLWQRRSLKLLRYHRPDARERAEGTTPVLIVPSMINRHYVVDLLEGQSLVGHLVQRGLDVYLADWGKGVTGDRFLDFDSCIEDLLGGAVERTCAHANADRVSLFGYCMGATMCGIYAPLHPDRVASLISLAGPFDFKKTGVMVKWTNPRYFDPDLIVDSLGSIPGDMMRRSFQWLVPTNKARSMLTVMQRGHSKSFMRSWFAIETWVNDNVPFPGEAYRKYVHDLYQQNLLIKGEYRVRGRPAKLEQIRCPVLAICATKDHIVPVASSRPLIDLCGSEDATLAELEGGHVGIVVGGGARKYLWPTLDSWLLPRCGVVEEAA